MRKKPLGRARRALIPILVALLTATPLALQSAQGASVDASLKVVSKTTQQSVGSQQKIDKLAVQSKRLLEEYQRILRNTSYQDAYNAELQHLHAEQQAEIVALGEQLEEIKLTQMQIVPLIRTMADSLEKFVVLDLPFKQEERLGAVMKLKQRLRSPSLSVSDKFRLILEAYQIENAYNYSVEAYRGPLQSEGESLSVEFLRIGRVALYYRSLDDALLGTWNTQERNWQELDAQYAPLISKGLRIASQAQAPELFSLPMLNTGGL